MIIKKHENIQHITKQWYRNAFSGSKLENIMKFCGFTVLPWAIVPSAALFQTKNGISKIVMQILYSR